MERKEDKQWATKYLLDPLTAPEPSDETGPGTHHTMRGSTAPSKSSASASVRSVKQRDLAAKNSYPSPPHSSTTERFPDFDGEHKTNRFSTSTTSTQIPTSTGGAASTTTEDTYIDTRPRRSSSLLEKHPGDKTHRPLDMLRQNEVRAQRSPHLRRRHHSGADSIDSLDNILGGAYHHEGPYDAASLARNLEPKYAPLAAVAGSNREALRATPREKVHDSIQRHYPLDGTAIVPPGSSDRYGRRFNYAEGTDMMREDNPAGGAYRRWPGMQYDPHDLKGKGEPSYTIEKALKTHKRNVSEQNPRTYELASRGMQRPQAPHRRSSTGAVSAMSAHRIPEGAESYVDWERGAAGKEAGTGARLSRGFGSLRKRL